MTDIVDKETRSRMMSGIRSADTKPEILVRKALHCLGYRFRLKSKVLNIRPDVVLRKYRVAIFVHGCYWHQHKGCKLAYSDRKYSEKWLKKFSDNRSRDERVVNQLLDSDWRVAVIWECATRSAPVFEDTVVQLHNWMQGRVGNYFETDYRKT